MTSERWSGNCHLSEDDEPNNYNRNRLEYEGANPTIQESETQETQRGVKTEFEFIRLF